ncbi:zinc finger domain-containing protein [Nakamurella flava]|uniref:zinc finger domain-containing protein n=1 Tax=Nakamurella flava TaxID=2576308 RepID=UPI003B845375
MSGPPRPGVGARVDLALTRNTALSVACEECGAAPGGPCINRWSGKPHERLPAHLTRIRRAEKGSGQHGRD